MFIHSGLTCNHTSTRCHTTLDLEVHLDSEFEGLTLVDGSKVHAQHYAKFVLQDGDSRGEILPIFS